MVLKVVFVFSVVVYFLFSPVFAQMNARSIGGLEEISQNALSDQSFVMMAQMALKVRPQDWKHAETDNFIYHYFNSSVATPVAVEAEFYYRVISKDLQRDNSAWQRKAHIFIFDTPADWKQFQSGARLDPWTGGIHIPGNLFILRDKRYRYKGNLLGHEIAHLVIDRFFGSNVPLWLNEGYAEYIASIAYASFVRARGYTNKPTSAPIDPKYYIPLSQLLSLASYPETPEQIATFYDQSHKLVRFLISKDSLSFLTLMEMLSNGALFNQALLQSYGSRIPNITALEKEFQPYAEQSFSPNAP